MDVSSIVGELLPLATSLFSLIEKIRTDSPDAWAAVTAQYGDAVANWDAAKAASQIPAAQIAKAADSVITVVESQPTTPIVETPAPQAQETTNGKLHELGVPHNVGR